MANDIVDDGQLKVQGNLTYTDDVNNVSISGKVTVAFSTSDVVEIDNAIIKVDNKQSGTMRLSTTTDPITTEKKRQVDVNGIPMEYCTIIGKAISDFIAGIKPYFDGKKTTY